MSATTNWTIAGSLCGLIALSAQTGWREGQLQNQITALQVEVADHYQVTDRLVHLSEGVVTQLKRQDNALTHTFPAEYSKKAWGGLTQEQVIALGEALKGRDITRATLYCASTNCTAIRADIDDALQIAGIDTEWEDRPVDIESETGIFVGCMICQNGQPVPKGIKPIMAGLEAAGLKPIVTDTESGLAIFFGKKPEDGVQRHGKSDQAK